MLWKSFVVILVNICSCLGNKSSGSLSLDLAFEKWIRSHKNITFGTDESFYAETPLLEEYDFIVVSESFFFSLLLK